VNGIERRARLARSRLTLLLEARPHGNDPGPLLDAALRGGVDIVRLRDEELPDGELVHAAGQFRRACDAHGALFVVDDRPDLVDRTGADGVHVEQGGAPLAAARSAVGAEWIIGLSAASPSEPAGEADYLCVGAIFGTRTAHESPPGGLELVRSARDTLRLPWFAFGGIDAATIDEAVVHGAPGAAVVRAIRDAADPEAAARALRDALPPSDVTVVRGGNVFLPQIDWLTGRTEAGKRGADAHTHALHADTFFLLDGTLEFRLGDGTARVPAGSCVTAPPLLLHGFRNPAQDEARFLNLHAPGVWARGRRAGLPLDECDQLDVVRASPQVRPILSAPGDGDRLTKPHRTALVKTQRPELAVFEYFVDAEYDGASSHVHLRHADCFHVLEGELAFETAAGEVRAEPGTSVVVPPGAVHAFTSVGRAHFLNVHAPSCDFTEYLRRLDAGDDFDAGEYDSYELT
jgi:thiamine-phosphate pyrophosphorylase